LALLGLSTIATAQISGTGPASDSGAASDTADAQNATVASDTDLSSLIAVLEDHGQRARLVARLKQLNEVVEAPPTLENEVLRDISGAFEERQQALEDMLRNVAESWQRIPQIIAWLRSEWENPFRRQVWLDVTMRLSGVFAAALIGRTLVRWYLLRGHRAIAGVREWRRVVAKIAGVTAFAAIAFGLLHYLDQPQLTRNAGVTVILGVAGTELWRLAVAAIVGFSDHRILNGPIWGPLGAGLTRAGTIGIVGYFTLRVADFLGLPWSFHGFAERLLFLIVTVWLCATIVRIRRPVADRLRRWSQSEQVSLVRLLPLRTVATVWHLVAIAIIILHYLFWAFAVQDGFQFLARATFLTIVIAALTHLSLIHVDRALADGVRTRPADSDVLLSDVQERASRYTDMLRGTLRTAIFVAAFLTLAWVWDTGLIGWLASPHGEELTSALFNIGILVVVTIFLCEGAAAAAKSYIGAVDEDGTPKHSNRARTLASILKNFVIVVAMLSAVMLGLSTIGVDAAALLAGAGVIGLAIGFGSQRLVQDLINGLFILLGDTVRVGDVVEVAGKAGVVENLSMRAVTLRSYDGSVHTVPYSSIDTVTNMTKDFSFAVLDIGVAYDSDIERVLREMVAVDAQLRREWPYRRNILAPLELAGVDALADSAIMIKARSKVRPGDQWLIRREFTKRIKKRFDEIGVEIPFPHRTVFFANPKTVPAAAPVLPQEAPAAAP